MDFRRKREDCRRERLFMWDSCVQSRQSYRLCCILPAKCKNKSKPLFSDVGTLAGRPGIVWAHLSGLSQVSAVERLGAVFGVHPLALEDVLNTNQRPKLEDYGQYIYVAIKMLITRQAAVKVCREHVNLILGAGFCPILSGNSGTFFCDCAGTD